MAIGCVIIKDDLSKKVTLFMYVVFFHLQCYMDHNRAINNSVPRYPLCAMQMYSHMSAVTDTRTCMRRSDKNSFSISPGVDFTLFKTSVHFTYYFGKYSYYFCNNNNKNSYSYSSYYYYCYYKLFFCLSLEMVCDPLGDSNVWASTRPLNITSKGHKMLESVVIAAARVSYRKASFRNE